MLKPSAILNRLTRDSEFTYIVLTQAVQLLGTIGLIKLLTHHLSLSEFGTYSLAASIIALISLFPFNPFGQAMLRYFSVYHSEGNSRSFLSNSLFIHVLIVLGYLLFSAIILFFPGFDHDWRLLLPMTIAYLGIDAIKNSLIAVANARRDRRAAFQTVAAEFALKFLLVIVLTLRPGASALQVYLVFALASGASTLVALWQERREVSLQAINLMSTRKVFRDLWYFSYPLFVFGSAEWLRNMSNRWILNHFLDRAAVAAFSVLGSLATYPAITLHSLVGSFFIPMIYEREHITPGFARSMIGKLIPVVLMIQVIATAVVFVLKNWIIVLITDQKYLVYAWMLPIMLASCFVQALSMIGTFEAFAARNTRSLILPMTIPGVAAVFVGYFATSQWGLKGAVFSFAFVNLLQGALVFFSTSAKKPDLK